MNECQQLRQRLNKMKEYLSFGAGVNSTALMLLLLDEGRDFESVYIDPGTEWPETYEFLDYLKTQGYEYTWIKPIVEGETNLYDYLVKWKILPSVFVRCCTAKFKTEPFYNYIEKPAIVYIGYDFGEHSRRHVSDKVDIEYRFPLVDKKITRTQCKEIIRKHGLKIPPKSGCWLCPFRGIKGFKKLRNRYPELFKKAMYLESINPRGFTILQKTSLSGIYQEDKLTDFFPSMNTEITTKADQGDDVRLHLSDITNKEGSNEGV